MSYPPVVRSFVSWIAGIISEVMIISTAFGTDRSVLFAVRTGPSNSVVRSTKFDFLFSLWWIAATFCFLQQNASGFGMLVFVVCKSPSPLRGARRIVRVSSAGLSVKVPWSK